LIKRTNCKREGTEMSCEDLNAIDPLKKQPIEGVPSEGLSPMDPPDAYAPPSVEKIDVADLHPFLRTLVDEHDPVEEQVELFEAALLSFQSDGPSREANAKIRDFFHFFDHEFVPHSRNEERFLFPLLHRRLIEVGEHSRGEAPTTAVDMLENDHTEALQLAAVVFNFFGVASRLPDENSRLLVLDAAIEQGKSLVELLKLHIFRENEVVFPLAAKHLTEQELETVARQTLADAAPC
jgi:hemerythrin-like domain-containing protein